MSAYYVYSPGIMDRCDPMILKGVAIEPGSIVRRRRKPGDKHFHSAIWVWIEDIHGNLQSVYKNAITVLKPSVVKSIDNGAFIV